MRTPHKPPPGWLSRPQATKYLGVSPTEFIRIAKRFGLESRKDKSTHIYRTEDVEIVAKTRGK